MQAVFALFFGAREDEGFVGKAEGLDEHHHHDGYLVVGSVDTDVGYGLGLVGVKHGHEQSAESLVHDAGHPSTRSGAE